MPSISTPICDFIRDYTVSGTSRFHMPGHKGSEILPELSFREDITEISGADSLYEASGIIRESEENASALFGTGATFYSTEGSSQCIRAMLALATRYCQDCPVALEQASRPEYHSAASEHTSRPVILAARNVHRSFLTAAALLDLEVEWLYPDLTSNRQTGVTSSFCSCLISAEQIAQRLRSMDPLPAAVYLTSPDYLGYLQDISAIADVVHAFGIPLLVDNAHGAYLHFLEQPLHPMDLGADMCCDSAHKTLPALTGCAYLHISKKAAPAYAASAKKALSLFGSTSPSYLLLQSLDQTNVLLQHEFPGKLKDCVSAVNRLRSHIYDIEKSNLDPDAGCGIEPGPLLDIQEPLKLTLSASACSMTGTELSDWLRRFHIECEYADPDHVVLMISPYNSPLDMERLEKTMETLVSTRLAHPARTLNSVVPPCGTVLQSDADDPWWLDATLDIDSSEASVLTNKNAYSPGRCPNGLRFPAPEKVLSIRQAALAPSRSVPLEAANGLICADLSPSCPPGIPILMCGERITEEAIRILRYYGTERIDVVC